MNKINVFLAFCMLGSIAHVPVANAASAHAGKIFLQVEEHGEAWYVNPATETRYYLQTGDHAYQALSLYGLGISNADLAKIPVGVSSTLTLVDNDLDRDGLHDSLERALGTSLIDSDSDDDGYSDYLEVTTGYSPLGAGTNIIDQALTSRLKGYILLQVESRGEAWYVNPVDGLRYYMEDGDAAYDLMRYMGIGITNADLATIAVDAASSQPPTDAWVTYGTGIGNNLSLTIDFPSDSLITNEALTDAEISATILSGASSLTVSWQEGSKTLIDFLGSTVDESRCLSAAYGSVSGTECLGVTMASMNAFFFESYGNTFMILDHNSNKLNEFFGDDWAHVLSSIDVTPYED